MTDEERDALRRQCLSPNVHVSAIALVNLLDENEKLRKGLEELCLHPCPTLTPGVHNALIDVGRKALGLPLDN